MKNKYKNNLFRSNKTYLLLDLLLIAYILVSFIYLMFVYKLTTFEYFVSLCLVVLTVNSIGKDD